MITFVGIIGKQDKPLYLKTLELEDNSYSEARLIELAYAASDVFDDRLRHGTHNGSMYFGLLNAQPDLALYGLMSNTKVKFILAIQATESVISESMVKSILHRIYKEYTKAVLNPFHLARVDDNEPLSSRAIDRAIDRIISIWPTQPNS